MSRVDNVTKGEVAALLKRVRELEMATPLSNASVGRGRLRMYDSSELLIEDGNLTISGVATVDGQLVGSGTFTWTGTTNLNGPTNLRGNMAVTGGGKVTVGAISLLPSGGPFGGGSIVGSSGVYVSTPTLHATGNIYAAGKVISTGRLDADGGALVTGDFNVIGSKNFRMEHPTKPGWWLHHGTTESPVSGTEYWGEIQLDADGEAVVELPEYFEALNKPRNRTVMVTPIGRPFAAGADRISDGRFTVYGEPHREVSWLVKAERVGGDFELEMLIEEPGSAELGAEAGDGEGDDDGVVVGQ